MSQDEQELWQAVIQNIRQLQRRPTISLNRPLVRVDREEIRKRRWLEQLESLKTGPLKATPPKLTRTQKVFCEASIDLHYLTLSEAEKCLRRFCLWAQQTDKRWVRVITGKGVPQDSNTLCGNVPLWLNQWDLVAEYMIALPKDGGRGALYVRLRRRIPGGP